MLSLTSARIEFQWGKREEALTHGKRAHEVSQWRWGSRHPLTLKCASFHALLLAFNSRSNEGLDLGILTWKTMEQERELGRHHPDTIEALGHLTQIYSKALKARCLLAEIYLTLGKYASAEREVRKALESSQKLYRKTDPERFRYKSILALAMYHSGKLDRAYRTTCSILASDWDIGLACGTKAIHHIEWYLFSSPESDGETDNIDQPRLDAAIEIIGNELERELIHPSLYMALLVIALVGKQRADTNGAVNARRIIHMRRPRIMIGSPLLALSYEVSLLRVSKPDDDGDYDMGLVHTLKQIQYELWDTWSNANSITASARRELIIAQFHLGEWTDPELHPGSVSGTDPHDFWNEILPDLPENLEKKSMSIIQMVSEEILMIHEARLGYCHPETMESLIWLFTLRALLLLPESLPELLNTGLERLHDEDARKERLAQSLRFEHRLATVILHTTLVDMIPDFALRALEMLRSICDTIAQLPEKDTEEGHSALLRGDLADLEEMTKADVALALQAVEPTQRPVANELRKQVEVEEDRGAYGAGAAFQEEQCRILGLLNGADHRATLEAQLKLAELKLRVKSPAQTEEAVRILSKMRDTPAVYLDAELGKRVDEAYGKVVSKRD
ncbi:hypothetical protein PGQ11_002535 [Apiospora arundinis]|uniref:Uncharacterized protein n=1 Tax=Apiospora arundinis TaxID=335852 RepID=A0ABR2JIS1_9PEZI